MPRAKKKLQAKTTAQVDVQRVSNINEWTDGVDLSQETSSIPAIYMAQDKSTPVTEGLCKPGEFISIGNNEVLSDDKGEMSMAVFYKTISCNELVEDVLTQETEFVRSFPMVTDPSDPEYVGNLQFRTQVDGQPNKIRIIKKCMYYFGLLKRGDQWDTSLPYIISFKGGAFNKGRQLSTDIYSRNAAMGLPPCAYETVLFSENRTVTVNKKSITFLVPSFRRGEAVPQEVIESARQWLNTVRVQKDKAIRQEAVATQAVHVSPVTTPVATPLPPAPAPVALNSNSPVSTTNVTQQEISPADTAVIDGLV